MKKPRQECRGESLLLGKTPAQGGVAGSVVKQPVVYDKDWTKIFKLL